MQIQVQIGDTRRVFFMNPPGSVEDLKENYILREIPRTRFMDFGLLYENNEGEYVVLNDVRIGRHSPRFACLLALLALARNACLLDFFVKTSRFHFSIWATPK